MFQEKCFAKIAERTPGATVVVDRGMAFADNLQQMKDRGYHYLVGSRPGERNDHLDEFEDAEGWQEIVREPSPTNPGQQQDPRAGEAAGRGRRGPPPVPE